MNKNIPTRPMNKKNRSTPNSNANPTKEKQLRLLNLNARSLRNKTDQLEIILLQNDPHIVAVTETWLQSDITDDSVFPASYQIIRKDRASRGGCVAVL